MKKPSALILIVDIIGSAYAIYLGIENENPLITGVGCVGLGIGLCLMGSKDILTRQSVEMYDDSSRTSTFTGLSAVLGGIFWLVGGLTAILAGLVVIARPQQNLLALIQSHPGLTLFILGSMALSYGGHLFLGSHEERSSALAFAGSLPGRIFALLLILLGAGMLLLSALSLFMPIVFNSLLSDFQAWRQALPCQINPAYCDE